MRIFCGLLLAALAVPAASAKDKVQDATLVSYQEIPSGPATPFDQIEQHLEWKLALDHQKDNHSADFTGWRTWDEQNLEKQLQDLEVRKSQYELTLTQAGLLKQPCAEGSAGQGCIKPPQSQYLIKIGRKSRLLLSPIQAGSKGNLYGLAPGTIVQIDVEREYVTVRVDGKECQYSLLEASW